MITVRRIAIAKLLDRRMLSDFFTFVQLLCSSESLKTVFSQMGITGDSLIILLCSTVLWRFAYLRQGICKVLQVFYHFLGFFLFNLTGGYWEPGQDVYGARVHNQSSGDIISIIPTPLIEFPISGYSSRSYHQL